MNLVRRAKNYVKRVVNDFSSDFRIIKRQNAELLWASTWNNTKEGIEWLQKPISLSPGRWAVGYNYLYVMTRILNDTEPHKILDLGLGISSTLISQYFDYYGFKNGEHTIIENNRDWVNFYTKKRKLSSSSKITICNCVTKKHQEHDYNAYEKLSDILIGKKYDVISIDGPRGTIGEASRRDILEYIPDILNDNFIIIIDDAERLGEQNTIQEIKNILSRCKIEYCCGYYVGETDLCVLTSPKYEWVCTL